MIQDYLEAAPYVLFWLGLTYTFVSANKLYKAERDEDGIIVTRDGSLEERL